MEEQNDHKKDRKRALFGTILFHALLAVLFLFYGLKEPHPPKEEKMVSIDMDLGTDNRGQGNSESVSQQEEPASESQNTQEQQQQEAEDAAQDLATQQESDVATETAEEEETEDTQEEEQEQEQEEEQNVSEELRQAQDRFKNMDDEGGGDGDDDVQGNEGDPSGSPEGKGDLAGAGGNWKLSGRKILQKPQPEKPSEEGKVVIDIWVDQQGNVVRTSPNLSESNTTSDQLLSLAEKAAKQAKFNPDSEGAVEQKGKFTFVFELH